MIIRVVRSQFDTIRLRNGQRNFKNINRIESEPFAVKRCVRVYQGWFNIQIQRPDNENRQLFFIAALQSLICHLSSVVLRSCL